ASPGGSRRRGLSLLVVRDSLDRNTVVQGLSPLVVRDSLDRNTVVRGLSPLVVRDRPVQVHISNAPTWPGTHVHLPVVTEY
ncbi:hypothetical protein ACFPJ5_13180, partial [Salinirubrum litoreum]